MIESDGVTGGMQGMDMQKGWLKEIVHDTHIEIDNWSESKKKSAQVDNVVFLYASKKPLKKSAAKKK